MCALSTMDAKDLSKFLDNLTIYILEFCSDMDDYNHDRREGQEGLYYSKAKAQQKLDELQALVPADAEGYDNLVYFINETKFSDSKINSFLY